MSLQPVLINGEWRKSKDSTDFFNATNPATKSALPDTFPVSAKDEVLEALEAGKKAADELRTIHPEKIAEFLESFADNIEKRTDEIVNLTNLETALPKEPRLKLVELPRTTNQLRQAASAARDRSWCMAVMDTKNNIHSKFGTLGGAVVVMGPNNFPFAFNSAGGGDFAAAIAAGNPVIAKANTSHSGATKIFAEAAYVAVKESGLPLATVQLIYRTKPDVGYMLVSHPLVGATGFTGGRQSGLKLKEAADKAGKPIYLEMSSVNPVFILPGAVKERSQDIAVELYGSCSLGAGQFCTNPGLVILSKDNNSDDFINYLAEIFKNNAPGTLLSAAGPKNIADAVQIITKAGAEIIAGGKEAEGPGYAFQNTLLKVPGEIFLKNPHELQTEAFGTVSLLVVADSINQMTEIAASLEGNLTGSLYTHSEREDDEIYNKVENILSLKVGRILNDKMPTGVAVVPSMNHGGPFPATGHPGFTAVGIPRSMLRFAALHCYDNVRKRRLPEELQDKNPTGKMWRYIDDEWSQNDVKR